MEKEERNILYFLLNHGFTFEGAAGLMGNLKAESNLNPFCYQNYYLNNIKSVKDYIEEADNAKDIKNSNFVKDSIGFGLAKWKIKERKFNLLQYAKKQKKSVGDLKLQLEFLVKELESDFSKVYQILERTKSVKEASDCVLEKFERPKDQSPKIHVYRESLGQKIYQKYYANYGNINIKEANKYTDLLNNE